MSMLSNEKSSFLSKFSPKASFFLGFASALLVFFIVGFFVLLSVVLDAKKNPSGGGLFAKTQPTVQQGVGAPTAQPDGSIQLAEVTKDDWVKGDRDAKVKIIEFSDIDCPFCQRVHPTVQQVVDQYDGKVAWVYRHFPLTQLHPNAERKAQATECAGAQQGNDGFWKMLDYLMTQGAGTDPSQVPSIAAELGMDKSAFESCLTANTYTQKIQDHMRQADAAGGRGTPYFVIVSGDTKVPISGAVPATNFQSVIDSLL